MTYVRDDLRPVQRRVAMLLVACAVLFGLLLARLWLLQVLQGEHWRRMAESNRLRKIPLEAPRGVVTDVHGEIVVGNRPAFQLLLFPEEMEDPESTTAFLARLGIAPEADVRERVEKARRTSHLPSVIADNLTWSQVAAIAAHRSEFRALEVHQTTRRSFPLGAAAAHMVGQLGEVNRAQLEDDAALRPGQLVGRSGLERAYQDVLGGSLGSLVVVVDALGRQVSQLDEEQPVPGQPLSITIDSALQREAAEAMSGQVGAVVALDPRDGAVRILVSEPAFDPELFAGYLEPSRWRELTEDPRKPLTNRALQALYPPGSTIKPVYAAGALRDGVRTLGDRVYCTGTSQIYGHPYRCWQRGGHGSVNLEQALEVSCDTYFYYLARDAGLDRLAAWARAVGLGQPTGIELAGESSGLVPSEAWSQRVRGQQWYAGETISVGIGQGPILATPLQLAVAYAALVNGGFVVRPHLVASDEASRHATGIPAAVLAAVRRGMQRVVAGSQGTARHLGTLPVAFAGKTGTAQVVRKREGVRWQELPWEQRHHALFVGYAPVDDPRLVVAVVVEHGGDAASVAAPIAARIFQRAFGAQVEGGAPPDVLVATTGPRQPTTQPGGASRERPGQVER